MPTLDSFADDSATANHPSALDAGQLRALLATALDAGAILMEAGATIPVVEQVVQRLGKSMGAEWMDVYCTPTGIIAMASTVGEHRTRVHRIVSLSVDLARVDAVMALSRDAEAKHLSVEEVRVRLETIRNRPRNYGLWVTVLAVAVGCGAFAHQMGGAPIDVGVTVLIAAAGQLARVKLISRNLSPLVTTAAVASLVALLGVLFGFTVPIDSNHVISAGVLLLVPGVFLVGSVYELISGNLVSGLARGAYAALTLMAIGAGILLVVTSFLAWST